MLLVLSAHTLLTHRPLYFVVNFLIFRNYQDTSSNLILDFLSRLLRNHASMFYSPPFLPSQGKKQQEVEDYDCKISSSLSYHPRLIYGHAKSLRVNILPKSSNIAINLFPLPKQMLISSLFFHANSISNLNDILKMA